MPTLPILALLIPLLTAPSVRAETNAVATPPAPKPLVYVIPIDAQIEPALTYVVRRGLREAEARKADAIIFRMDTLGGRLDATEDISALLRQSKLPMVTYVERNAISAGAIIALATERIYMAPGSKIGDAMPIVMGQTLGDAEREKAESFTDSMVRVNIEHSGHRKEIGTAMVRRHFEFKIGEEVLSPEGQILTLTNEEAARIMDDGKPLLSSGTLDSFEDLLPTIGYANAEIVTLQVESIERFARFIATIAPILLMIGMAAIYFELQTPGVGLPALVAAVCFGLFFFGHHIAGLAGAQELVVFSIGVILLLVEVFVLPGFGITGVTGILLILWSLLSSMMDRMPDAPVLPTMPELALPLGKLAFALIGSGALIGLAGRYLPRNRTFGHLILSESTSAEKGYTAVEHAPTDLVGHRGVALSALHPSGTIRVDGVKRDALTHGEFIDPNTPVEIVEVKGSRIVVRAAPPSTRERTAP